MEENISSKCHGKSSQNIRRYRRSRHGKWNQKKFKKMAIKSIKYHHNLKIKSDHINQEEKITSTFGKKSISTKPKNNRSGTYLIWM